MLTINNSYLVISISLMALVTFASRAMPAVLPKRWLDTAIMHRLNESLPLAVMILLILSSLDLSVFTHLTATINLPNGKRLIAQLLALVMVLLSYHRFKNLLLSMVTGILAINLVMMLLG